MNQPSTNLSKNKQGQNQLGIRVRWNGYIRPSVPQHRPPPDDGFHFHDEPRAFGERLGAPRLEMRMERNQRIRAVLVREVCL
jgi:hypothetical protein